VTVAYSGARSTIDSAGAGCAARVAASDRRHRPPGRVGATRPRTFTWPGDAGSAWFPPTWTTAPRIRSGITAAASANSMLEFAGSPCTRGQTGRRRHRVGQELHAGVSAAISRAIAWLSRASASARSRNMNSSFRSSAGRAVGDRARRPRHGPRPPTPEREESREENSWITSLP